MAALVWSREAVKVLRRMQPRRAAQIRATCSAIAADPPPGGQHANLRPLVGVLHGYRVRFGDWRGSFRIDQDTDTVEVFEVAPRGSAYRW